jgi:hypothetical protein
VPTKHKCRVRWRAVMRLMVICRPAVPTLMVFLFRFELPAGCVRQAAGYPHCKCMLTVSPSHPAATDERDGQRAAGPDVPGDAAEWQHRGSGRALLMHTIVPAELKLIWSEQQ